MSRSGSRVGEMAQGTPAMHTAVSAQFHPAREPERIGRERHVILSLQKQARCKTCAGHGCVGRCRF
jgi:hypothetical protein